MVTCYNKIAVNWFKMLYRYNILEHNIQIALKVNVIRSES